MKNKILFYSSLVLLLNFYCNGNSIPYLSFRSQSVNAAREMVGWEYMINRADVDTLYGSMSITPAYGRSMQPNHIAQWLFNPSLMQCDSMKDCLSFKVQGSQVPNRDPRAWLADYFYLPTDFQSKIDINPTIDTFLVDFNFYIGFDSCLRGLYLTMHAPAVHTRWDLGFCESNIYAGINDDGAGYFTPTFTIHNSVISGLSKNSLLQNFEEFVFDQKRTTTDSTISFEPLRKARMSPFRLNDTKLAEIQIALGYNILLCDDYYLGLQLRGSIPTGNRPEGKFLFEPIVGNGHHGELGIGLCGHWRFWQDECIDQNVGFFLNAYATHLFKTEQCRTFDLKGKPLSRYMLAMHMDTPITNLLIKTDGNIAQEPTMQFKNMYSPVANLTTIPVHVSSPIQLDIAFKFAYVCENIELDLGYNFWYRSCEKIRKISTPCCPFKFDQNWAIKGDSYIYGFPNKSGIITQPGVALSATQSNATIFNGTNNMTTIPSNTNPGINMPKGFAIDTSSNSLQTHDYANKALTWQNVYSSLQPITIKEQDINIEGARTGGLSNKIFTHLNYTAWQCYPWTPYIGFGGEVEFGKNLCKETCSQCALSQWTFWIKAGLSFEKLSRSCAQTK